MAKRSKENKGQPKVGERKWRVFWEMGKIVETHPKQITRTDQTDVSASSAFEAAKKVLVHLGYEESAIVNHHSEGKDHAILIQSQGEDHLSYIFYYRAYPICKCCGGKGVITGKYNI